MARCSHVDTTLLIAWSLLALVVAGCPGGDPEYLPCNRNADCPAGEVCKDGQCTPREALRPGLDAMTVGDGGFADRVAADAPLAADGARSDLAPADLGGRDQSQVPDSGGGLDAAAPDAASTSDGRVGDAVGPVDRVPVPASAGHLRSAAGWSSGQRFRLRSRIGPVLGQASGQRFTLTHRLEVQP